MKELRAYGGVPTLRVLAVVLAAAIGVAFVAPLGPTATRVVSEVGSVVLGVLFVGAGFAAARRAQLRSERLAWCLVATATLVALAAYAIDPLGADGADIEQRIPVAFHIGPWMSLLQLIALACVVRPRLRRDEVVGVTLDSAWMAVGALAVTWTLVGEPTLAATSLGAWSVLSLAAVAVVTALTLGFGSTLLLRAAPTDRTMIAALLTSAIALGTAQAAFGVAFHHRAMEFGTPIDYVFIAAFAVATLAATWGGRAEPSAAVLREPGRGQVALTLVPLVAWVLAAALQAGHGGGPFAGVGRLVVVVGMARLVYLVVENGRMARRLHGQATLDPLTGLPNRRALNDSLAAVEAREIGLLLIDLDRFKVVNDTLGHRAGDELIRLVADRIAATVGDEWFVARLAGDEFVAYRPGVTLAELENTGRAVIHALRQPIVVEGCEAWVGASVGAALSADGSDGADLVDVADLALRVAKDEGRGTVVTADPAVHERSRRSAELIDELRRGIDADELVVHFQPSVDLATGALHGVEALVRWDHPRHGLVMPDDFVPMAEASGLITRIDSRVLALAVRHLRDWNDLRPLPRLGLSVNMSAWQLARTDVDRQIAAAMSRHGGVDPAQLVVELTETSLIDEPGVVARRLERLRAVGLGVAVDDFGDGFTSLAHLRRFPVSHVKIDKSLVAELDGTAGDDRSLVAAVVALARALEIEVVAEGVETVEQAHGLRRLGCRIGQGFLFARPLPAAEIDALLREKFPFADAVRASSEVRGRR